MNNKLMVVCGLMAFGALSYFFTTHKALILVLEAVIFIELFRSLWEFAFKDDHRIKLRYVIDGGFVFIFKEFYLACLLVKKDLMAGSILIGIFLVSMFLIIWIRKLLMQISPSLMED